MKRLPALLALSALIGACNKSNPLPIASGKKTMADSADQVIFGLHTLITDRGLLRASIDSDTAFFFDDNTRADMIVVRGVFFGSTGAKDAVLTSMFGNYNNRLGTLEAHGEVEVASVDGRTLKTPFLRFDQRTNQISSDSAFTLKEPGRDLVGVGFRSDADLQNIIVKKLISSKAGTVALPDQ
ncbi:MAG TPA: LPS export ABC transporter periplasmic protein LptC [Gemmatimonadaceae bacterium]|nr:LPS export ABC transporter periplasmic protein LptC [Gemmatimonadaceae bacterium]